MVLRMWTWFKGRRNLGELKQEEWWGTYDKKEHSSQRLASEKTNTLKQRNKQVLFSLQTQIFKKQTIGFCCLWALFLFCFCASERTRKIHWLRWKLYVSRKDKKQINHLGSVFLSNSQPYSSHPLMFQETQPNTKLLSQICQMELELTRLS